MNETTTSIEMLLERAEDYGNTTIELMKLNAIDKSANLFSVLATKIAILFLIVIVILMASIGMSLWMGELLGKLYYGFFATAVCYTIIAVLMYNFRFQLIKEPVRNYIINQMLK